jgi:RHS repeat-associated protein
VTLSYDQENRITGAAGYTYTYDADGNRVKKSNGSTGTLYWYMTAGIVAESDLTGVLKSEYVFFGGERVARKDFPSNAVSYYFSDHLKTASVITDAAGNIKSESDFYPWGGELQFVNNDSNRYKFTGKERDSETGLDYFGARYYSNGLGRWVSADWSPTPVPVPYADFGNPQSLNLYGFVGGNPASKADPDGHFPLLALAGGGALAEFGGPVLVSNPVGWTVLGVAAVATIGYVAYEHFHTPPSTSTSTNTGTPATTPTNTQTGTPASTATSTETGAPASTSQSGSVSSTSASTNTGTIYKVPGASTKSGKPYIGRHNKPNPAKTRRSNDGRDRSKAKVVDKYPADDPQAGRVAEQKQIDKNGGVEKLDNMRNEIKQPK